MELFHWNPSKTTIMQPIEYHTFINYDFKAKKWFQNDFFGQRSIAEDSWAVDNRYFKKYPILKDSLGIKS